MEIKSKFCDTNTIWYLFIIIFITNTFFYYLANTHCMDHKNENLQSPAKKTFNEMLKKASKENIRPR